MFHDDATVVLIRATTHGYVIVDRKARVSLQTRSGQRLGFSGVSSNSESTSGWNILETSTGDILIKIPSDVYLLTSAAIVQALLSSEDGIFPEEEFKLESIGRDLYSVPQLAIDGSSCLQQILTPSLKFMVPPKSDLGDLVEEPYETSRTELWDHTTQAMYPKSFDYYSHLGEWDRNRDYKRYDMVSYDGDLYICPPQSGTSTPLLHSLSGII